MFKPMPYSGSAKDNGKLLLAQLEALIDGETSATANLANASALLNQYLDDINWVGFYLADGDELVLGPFQGMPACVRIPFGKGVCGTSAQSQRTLRIDDVHSFPGHIACDAASNSEIVIPLIKEDRVLGVLDIDSPLHKRFNDDDQALLESFCRVLVSYL